MDLDELLRREAAVGRLDSQGQFSLDVERSRRTLREFQLAEPAFYVLKLIQAAIAAGASQVRVERPRGQVSVDFACPSPPALPSVLEALALRAAPRAARHLAVGLNAAMAVADSLEYTVHSQGLGRVLRLTREETEVLESPESGPEGTCRVLVRKTPRLLALPASTASEQAAVFSRCAWADAEVLVDGKPVAGPLPAPAPEDWLDGLSAPFYLMLHFDLGQGLRVPGPDLGEAHREGGAWVSHPPLPAFLTEFSGFRPLPGALRCRGAYALPLGLSGPGAVIMVLDGVALDPEIVPGAPPGALAVLAAEDLRVDLSEFKAVQDARFLEQADRVWERWNTMVARVEASLPELRGYLPVPPGRLLARLVGGLGPPGRIAARMMHMGSSLLAARRDLVLRRRVARRLRERP